MTSFDSPIEALAFEYASFGVLVNVWTWIAFVTAAVSFWRIRVTSIGDNHVCGLLEESKNESVHLEPQSVAAPVEETVARVKETVTKPKVSEPLMCDDGVTKGKLTMYYEVDVDGERCVDGELTAVNYDGSLGDCGEWWEKWERVVTMRNGDDSWYRYVDLTVINGSVVRFWDDNGNRNGEFCF